MSLQVKQLIDLYNEGSYLFHLLRDNKTKCAYVACYKKDVVGIFFTWGSNFHPYCTYFRIYTNPFLLTLVLLGLRIKRSEKVIIHFLAFLMLLLFQTVL